MIQYAFLGSPVEIMTNSIAMNILCACGLKIPFPSIGQEMYKMNLEHLLISDSKETTKHYQGQVKSTHMINSRSSHWPKPKYTETH